jgi:hypothetical protein
MSILSAQAQNLALESGDWPGIAWSMGEDPRPGDQVQIGNELEVRYSASDRTRVGRILVGRSEDGLSPNGTLTIADGVLQTASNGSLAIQIGQAEASTGVLNVNGGELIADNGGWLTVGSGVNSTGIVNLSAGRIQTDSNNVSLGNAEGSTGIFTMSGGSLEIAGTFFVGRVHLASNSGQFSQSGGVLSVGGPLRIGNATAARHQLNGSVNLTGGTTTINGSIIIANTIAGQLGQGKLSVSAESSLVMSGDNSTLILGDKGELEFLLGADSAFNAIDLTAVRSRPAVSLLENSLIVVDGRGFMPTSNAPVKLLAYANGRGPSGFSLANIRYQFVDFDPSFNPGLQWTDSGLVLTLR